MRFSIRRPVLIDEILHQNNNGGAIEVAIAAALALAKAGE